MSPQKTCASFFIQCSRVTVFEIFRVLFVKTCASKCPVNLQFVFQIPLHCVRRSKMVPHKETEFSNQSIMKAMEKFVAAVQEMDETILVPSRLMDLQVGDSGDTVTKGEQEQGQDLYQLYTSVNAVRRDLLWGGGERPFKGHARRPSNVSTASLSSSLSDTDSEANENDSGIEEADRQPSPTARLEESFRRHLHGLHRCLDQMTEAASYLTARYQNHIGPV